MSKLFALSEWVTLEEAADYLTQAIGEPVTTKHLRRLALDKRIVLSVHFVNHARVHYGRKVAMSDANLCMLPKLLKKPLPVLPDDWPATGRKEQEAWLEKHRHLFEVLDENFSLMIDGETLSENEDEVLEFDKEVKTISGVWDLPMLGAEALDITHTLQQELGGPDVTLVCLGGPLVVSPDGERYARVLQHFPSLPEAIGEALRTELFGKQKQELYLGNEVAVPPRRPHDPDRYFPAGKLPDDAPLVMRTAEVIRFAQSVSSSRAPDKPLGTRERNTLLCIIGALAQAANVDLSQPMKAGEAIAAMMPGIDLSPRTIGDHLKAVRDAMESRTS